MTRVFLSALVAFGLSSTAHAQTRVSTVVVQPKPQGSQITAEEDRRNIAAIYHTVLPAGTPKARAHQARMQKARDNYR